MRLLRLGARGLHSFRRRSATMSASALAALSPLAGVAKTVGIGYALTCTLVFVKQRQLQYLPSTECPEHPRLQAALFDDIVEAAPAEREPMKPYTS